MDPGSRGSDLWGRRRTSRAGLRSGALGVLLSPEHTFYRRSLTVQSRRPADPSETVAIGPDRIVVEIFTKPSTDASGSPPGDHVELALTDQALTGFLAWLEASPPGSHLTDFS